MKITNTKKIVLAAACVALCVVLPMAFHSFPGGGNVFLPMHIPVLLCGLLCSWPYGLLCGLMGPALSSLITGMPPAAFLPSMMVECAVYGCVAGIMMQVVRTKKTYVDLYISLITAMIAGRFLAGVVKALILAPGTPMFAWVTTSLVEGLPGIAIQLVVIPALIFALTRAKLLPRRYDNE
jgi:thiamine transporter ThiT